MKIDIVPMSADDWSSVSDIYASGIATGQATFQTSIPSWSEWNSGHLESCRLIARAAEDGAVVGWAALSGVSSRCVYSGVAEVSVYVSAAARGRGVGRRLLAKLIEESEREGLWTLQSGIFPENEASVALHVSCGFRIVGKRERIGCMNGVWRDSLLLERRSRTLGL